MLVEIKDRRDRLEVQVVQVQQDHKEVQDQVEIKGKKEQQALQAHKDHKEIQVQQVQVDQLVIKDRKV